MVPLQSSEEDEGANHVLSLHLGASYYKCIPFQTSFKLYTYDLCMHLNVF